MCRSEILHRLLGSIDIYETGQILVVLLAVSSCATHGRINEARSKRFDRYLSRLAREYI